MFIKADEDRFINRDSIYDAVRYDNQVYFKDNSRRTIGSRKFDSIEEAKDYCEKLTSDINAEAVELVVEKVENLGHNLGNLLEEMKKIKQVLGA